MGVFNVKNERFLLTCMFAVFLVYAAYYSTIYYLYLNTDDFPEAVWDTVAIRAVVFIFIMVVLSGFYFRSCGSGRKGTFDFLLFYYFTVPLSLLYCSYRYKGFLRGTALIIFWIIAFFVPQWTWYLVSTWTYWGYESS